MLCAVLLLLPVVLHAQQPGTFGEVLEVGLTNVDVIVTDGHGAPIHGLAAADFEVFENGKPQPITNFFASTGTGGTATVLSDSGTMTDDVAAPVARKFIFYIDDTSLSLDNRRAVFPAVRKFLATQLRAGDQAMLVSWNRELKVRAPWTSDLATIDKAVEKLGGEVSSAAYLQADKQRVERLISKMAEEANTPGSALRPHWHELENAARSYAETYRNELSHSSNALARLLASLAGIDGKKILVIATDSFPTIAGAELFEHLENVRVQATMSATSFLRAEANEMSKISNLSRYNVEPMLDTLARAANATGVTIYGINPHGLSGPASGKTELQMPGEVNVEFARLDQALAGISLLANRTGGVAMVGAPAELALSRVGRDLDAYYSLGYRSTKGTSTERKIEVHAKRPGLHVRTRTHVYYRSLEREMADRVIANHLQRQLTNELGVSLQADTLVSDGLRPILPVRVVIPVDMLTLLPDGKGGVTGGFSVFTCSSDGSGGTSGVNVQSHGLAFTAEQAAQLKGRRIGFAIQVPLENGRDRISVGVLDHVSQEQGFVTMKAELKR
jgi:VWFA-related protein